MKKNWHVWAWSNGGKQVALTVDYRDTPKAMPFSDAKPLIQIPITDRYTFEEYQEIAQLIADRMNAWEVEQKLVE